MSGGDSGARGGLEIGRTLESARKERGLSLREVEEATKIRVGYLADLERENFDVLPAVYMQGSLRTYANFLQLDGEAMVRELKRRQGAGEEHRYPLYVGPQEEDSIDDILTALGGAAQGTRERDAAGDEEDDKMPALLPAGMTGYLYLGSVVALVLVAAVFALTVAGDERPSAVSQVREPLISQAPETSPPEAEGKAGAGREEEQAANDDRESAGPADPQAGNDKDGEEQASRPEQDRDEPPQARSSASATASAPGRYVERRSPSTAEPSRRSPARQETSAPQEASAPPSSPSPAAQPGGAPSGGNGSPSRRGGGALEVRVAVGADDPVRLSGGPFDD